MNTRKAFANLNDYAEGLANFESITPKAFANFSPGLERSDNPGIRNLK
jgi:hypothetical protein